MTTPPDIMVQLIHISGGLKGEIQEFFDDVITVGRLSSCLVKFPPDEPGVSREHARIQREGNQFKLIDQSKFGTSVNGKPVREAFLKSGDVLEFGPGGPKVSITMEVAASAPPRRPAYAEPAPAPRPSPPPAYERPRQEPVYERPRQEPVYSAPPAPPEPRPTPASAGPLPGQKSQAPLVIQFGPTIRSFRELPVTLGAGSRADFPIRHPGIQDQHAQILFFQNSYWIRDLTGGSVQVNRMQIGAEAQLKVNDEIELSPQGPVFRFLGEGRLAEVEQACEQPAPFQNRPEERVADTAQTQNTDNFLSKWVKGFKS